MIDRRSYKTIAFDSADARDAYLEREHPDRKALEQPGTYSLPNGDELGVFLNSVTIYAARFVQGAELAQAARESTAIEVEAGSALTPELEADLWRRGEVRQRATRVREICQRAQELIGSPRQALARRSPDRALELLDELADAAGALVEAQAAGERAPRPPMDPPPGAIAYKYADPTEGARWLYDETELRRVRSEDPNLIVAVETHGTSRRDFEAELAMALLETVDELETAYSILEQLEDAPLPAEDAGAIGRVLNAERESKAQSDRRRLLQERLNDPREGYVEGGESDAR